MSQQQIRMLLNRMAAVSPRGSALIGGRRRHKGGARRKKAPRGRAMIGGAEIYRERRYAPHKISDWQRFLKKKAAENPGIPINELASEFKNEYHQMQGSALIGGRRRPLGRGYSQYIRTGSNPNYDNPWQDFLDEKQKQYYGYSRAELARMFKDEYPIWKEENYLDSAPVKHRTYKRKPTKKGKLESLASQFEGLGFY
jgi:hypothetical protein